MSKSKLNELIIILVLLSLWFINHKPKYGATEDTNFAYNIQHAKSPRSAQKSHNDGLDV